MKVGAIIAEYNPFHNGHKYQIAKFKKESQLDYVLVIMSGNFTQRGEPAWMPKHSRAEMALMGGADLVIELPLYYATANASLFAEGAIAHLNALGCIDELCFGCETDDSIEALTSKLDQASDILIKEPDEYKSLLLQYIKEGYSYPSARERALSSFFEDCVELFSPNNILAMEYIISLKKTKSLIQPKPIVRKGLGYHDLNAEHSFASASAIRKQLSQGIPDDIQGLPLESLSIIQKNYHYSMPLSMNDFSNAFAISYILNKDVLNTYLDINDDLANLIMKHFETFTDLDSFISTIKNKAYTYTRLSRCMNHILTDQKKDVFGMTTLNGYAHYARVLGFKKSSTDLLNQIKKSSSIPLITKLSVYKDILDTEGQVMIQMDIESSNLYRTVSQIKYKTPLKNEFTEKVVII